LTVQNYDLVFLAAYYLVAWVFLCTGVWGSVDPDDYDERAYTEYFPLMGQNSTNIYWTALSVRYYQTASVADVCFGMSASSVSVEFRFSVTGLISSTRRCTLGSGCSSLVQLSKTWGRLSLGRQEYNQQT